MLCSNHWAMMGHVWIAGPPRSYFTKELSQEFFSQDLTGGQWDKWIFWDSGLSQY